MLQDGGPGSIFPPFPVSIPPGIPESMAPTELNPPISVLVVDDEELLARSCGQILTGEGYTVQTECRGSSALEVVRRQSPDIVLVDLMLPDIGGIALLREVLQIAPGTLVIVITGFATVDSSIEAMEAGAYDYIPKPFTATQLRILIGRAAQQVRLRRVNAQLRDQLRERYDFEHIVGQSDAINRVFSVVSRVATTEASVFVSGESGTGKELIARAIHANSRRAERPFVAVNCAALPDQLLESELFGHEKGSFTGADGLRRGLLETAAGGTFFLDEISEMSLDLQAKLLRVVQERKVRRVGGESEIPLDVRWVTATNRDPDGAVRDGLLRQDLYFRLNVVPVRLPPLRERTSDIPLLAHHFLRRFAERHGRSQLEISAAVLDALEGYDWPGNVRELQNMIERMVSLSSGDRLELGDVPEEVLSGRPPISAGAGGNGDRSAGGAFHEAKAAAIADFERRYLREMLSLSGGNISEAARQAGIDRKTIHRMLDKHGLEAGG
jgi:DNA-binding NtrC family response regulator